MNHEHRRDQVSHELLLSEASPLLDQRAVGHGAAQELVGLGAGLGEEAHDGLPLRKVEGAVGGGKGGDLAEGELGEDGGPFGVGGVAELEVVVFEDFEIVEFGYCLGLWEVVLVDVGGRGGEGK